MVLPKVDLGRVVKRYSIVAHSLWSLKLPPGEPFDYIFHPEDHTYILQCSLDPQHRTWPRR